VPDDPSAAGGELAALRAANARLCEANARLRQVAEAKDTEIAALRAALEASQARQAEVIRRLELRAAELQRRAGMDSRNSSIAPSKESLAAKARRKAARRASLRERSKQRKPRGQPGHEGSGLEPERNPDRTEQADPPTECRSCGTGLAGAGPAGGAGGRSGISRRCGWRRCTGWCPSCAAARVKVTCPDPPDGQAGTVIYGPNVNAAAVLLNSEGNVPVERTAMLMAALVGAPVSAGFVTRAHERLAQRLETGGFDMAIKAALRAEPVMCADESPANVIRNIGEEGAVLGASRTWSPSGPPMSGWSGTPPSRLVPARRSRAWACSMTTTASWSATTTPAGPSSMPNSRGCSNAASTYPASSRASTPCTPTGSTGPKTSAGSSATPTVPSRTLSPPGRAPSTLTCSRTCGNATDTAVHWGEITNRLRDWDDGKNHPGYVLARRLKTKAEQVWLFTRDFAVPWTNSASEQAIKGPKRHQAVSGYWHSLATLAHYCRVRSYLVTSRNHGIRPTDAIQNALTGRPWLPVPASA
jgi:transposase